jgi:hypothetical protein
MARIDAEMRAFIESDVDNMIATRNARFEPHMGRAWGPRVAEDGDSLEVFVDRAHSQDVLADLRDNGLIAVSWSHPMTSKTIQLKGRCVEIGEPAAADYVWIDRHRRLFTDQLVECGFRREFARSLWSNSVVRVRLVVEQAFDQTPGPAAGRPL